MRLSALCFFVLSFVMVSFFFFYSPSFVHAQTSYTTPTNQDPSVPSNLHTYTQDVLLEVFSAVGCQIVGVDIASLRDGCLGLNPQTGQIGYVKTGGLIGMTNNMIGDLYSPPARLGDYTSDLAQNFGLVKPAYAQGIGYEGISPLVDIWKLFRNIVYLFFVIVFVIIGFAIMLRFRIDPRTVMSIENQLPKLIIGLLLVTFSFAIAGVLIDGMWVLTFLVINLLTPYSGTTAQTVNTSLFQNPIGFFNNVSGAGGGLFGVAAGAGGSVSDILRSLFTSGNAARLGLVPPSQGTPTCVGFDIFSQAGCWVVTTVSSKIDVGAILSNALGYLATFLLGIVGTVVVLIALLVGLFRVWFALLLAYVYILLDVVIGPFFIVIGVIPGSKVNFSSWIRDLLANLISFPTVIAVFLLGNVFMQAFVTKQGTTGITGTNLIFVPPIIGDPTGGQNGGQLTTNPLGWLLGLAIILIAPSIVDTMKSLFKVENKLGAQIGQGIVGGVGVLINAGKNAGRTYIGSNEYISKGGPQFEKRGWLGGVFGGIVGR